MPSKKIKISELPLVESLKGLYTIGYKIIDGIKTSVKVSLEDIQTAYQDVVNAVKNSEVATKNANTAASNANEKAVLADTAAANANDTAEHPTYIGQDHYVYKWNKTAQAYDKTDIYTKGDAFSIKKVYASVANMEADKSNPDITEGDFVLVNTGDVEDPDNAKLYVKADGDFEFLVDMSGAIGFTGKTPQFSIGTISTLEAGSTATATISEDGVDSDGNPKYKINFAIPRGNPGAPFRIAGEYATLEALKSAVPDGSAVDGFMAVGTEAPYDYYAWVNGDWVNQGKIAGGGSGNVVVIPAAAMSLSDQATSDEIFNAFGGKDAFMDICQSIVNKDTVCVVANIPEESGMKLVYIPVMAMATYTDANNANFMMAIITETTFQLVVTVTDGIATQSSQVLNHIYEAPSDGNVYGRKNKDWVKVPENSNVIILPKEILDLTGSSSSEEILAAFGGIDKYKDLLEKLSTNNCLVQIGEPSLGSLRHIYTLVEYAVNFASNKQSGALSLNIYNEEQQLRRLHFYLENNGTTARCGEASTFQLVRDTDVLTKTNTSSFTPTQPYQPATKKYVDDKTFVRDVDGTILNKWINNTVITGETVQGLVNELFGNFISFAENYAEGRYRGLRFSARHYDEEAGNYFGYIINANIQYCLSEPGNGYFELLFTFGYGSTLKSCYIYYYDVSETSSENKIVITDVVRSDNLTTLTKKTAAEYEALGSKDANTAYCVTD
ncbi:phage upper tail fiber protein [Bacteroides clarus]|uniref:phage upper tail fiber protein n=1 Tax=Bacteroides clarus TaxID=626929 RepID=UPI00117782A4|nr:hypothetical protein [Bacteroides clarus]